MNEYMWLDPVFSWIYQYGGLISAGLKHEFTTALVGSAMGALAGALAANRIAVRKQLKADLITEIRQANRISMALFAILNATIALKQQHLQAMWKSYFLNKEKYKEFLEKKEARALPNGYTFEYVTELEELNLPELPIFETLDLIYHDISISGPTLCLAITLKQVVHELKISFEHRNNLIHEYRALRKEDGQFEQLKAANWYFGTPDNEGHIDDRYSSVMLNLQKEIEDTLYFASRLAKEIHAHASKLGHQLKNEFKQELNIERANFDGAIASGLIPGPENYKDWEALLKKDTS